MSLSPEHLLEWCRGSAADPELAIANVCSFGPGAALHWEDARELLLADAIRKVSTCSVTASGAPQAQPGHLSGRLIRLRSAHRNLEAGGWWCAGLDPLHNWQAPMPWGCLKPALPRCSDEGEARKYEHPQGVPARTFWLRVPRSIALRVAERFRLEVPPDVAADADGSAGAFWRWWRSTPALPLLLTEGAKKAAALLTVGIPAVALPGIWNGTPKGPDDRPQLHPDLAGLPLADRPVWVLFDHSEKRKGRRAVEAAAQRLGRALHRAGARVLVGACPGPHKGADDHLAAGGRWEDLAAQLHPWAPGAWLPRFPSPALTVPAGRYLGDAVTLPSHHEARLVALTAPMGAGKTEAIAAHVRPLLQSGEAWVLLIGHRVHLVEAAAEALGLPTGDDARPDSPLRALGLACCVDSLCSRSALRIHPEDFAGAVVVLDEVVQVLAHLLTASTAVKRRRVQVLETLAAILRQARQVIVADALLSRDALAAVAQLMGADPLVIASAHQPAAGRQLHLMPSRDAWLGELVAHLQARRCCWVWCTAQQGARSVTAAENLQALAAQHWPGARVLLVDRITTHTPGHDAHRLASDPDGIASQYDLIVSTPAIASGLSVTLQHHFAAVFLASGGAIPAEDVVQAAGRVRDHCPRFLWVPQRCPGGMLRVGSGSTSPADIRHQLEQHEAATLAALEQVGIEPSQGVAGPWLDLWCRAAALRNGQRHTYRATISALLEREGYEARDWRPEQRPQVEAAGADAIEALQQIRTFRHELAQALTIEAAVLSDQQADELAQVRNPSPEDSAALERWRIDRAWNLQGAEPSPELLEAHRAGLHRALLLRYWLTDGRDRVGCRDREQGGRRISDGRHWAPDLTAATVEPKVRVLEALDLPRWMAAADWFPASDARLALLQAQAETYGQALAQVLAVTPGKSGSYTLRSLLALVGFQLERKQRKVAGQVLQHRRAVPLDPPAGIAWGQLVEGWRGL